MQSIYTLLLYLLLPFVLLRLFWRGLRAPAYRQRWPERFTRFSTQPISKSIWVHSVSVGETQAAQPLVKRLLKRFPEYEIVITTTTSTGADRVQKLFGNSVTHLYFPYDTPAFINAFISHVRPKLLILMETEIWPNLLAICNQRRIVTILANARLSEKSARGYARFGPFTRKTFKLLSVIAAQNSTDAERFMMLGAISEQVLVTGNIKFDLQLTANLQQQAAVLRRQWGERPVWVAASTHEGEDEQLIRSHRIIMQRHPQALLVLVPRHPPRSNRVATQVECEGFSFVRRSTGDRCTTAQQLLLGDTMGELTLFLAAADAAFVGGSLVPVGGHNILEPAALGLPVVYGPHMFNFSEISNLLLLEQAALQVANAAELANVISHWLSDEDERTFIGENGRRVVSENRGALERLFAIIEEKLPNKVCC